MKVLSIVSGIALAITSVSAQLTAPMQNYNVSSPVSNGPYVEGQVLPCTIQLFSNIPSDSLVLSITLQSAAASNNVSLVIASFVDTTKTPASAKQNGNVTYYEHSVNYNIPTTITPGAYNVVFLDSSTNTQLDVPINILPVASSSIVSSAAATATGASASSTNSASAFKPINGGVVMSPSLITNAIVSLAGVAALAIML